MEDLLVERHEDLVNMLVHCRVKVEDRDDPNILDILTDIRALPGVVTVRQTRPLSDKKTSSGKRIIELNISYISKYINKKNPNPSDSDAMMQILQMLKTTENLDLAKLIDHDNEQIAARTIKKPIIV
tara:strand:+ start:230 stop:610 length:381 start_codon:yes stop_codon:yes gene_type:complete